ncbi:RHS repeat domain-containing protein [Pseudomonas sp. NA-150]|uniref:RHS repeat domain-containing protein n=1 Tax=Pseudomonas sp. NA-150 TaxID=3367525 RepID=UPI0037CBCE0E
MNLDVHRHTPTLTTLDSRGLIARVVTYRRTQAGGTPQARITRHEYNASGLPVADWDPRLFSETRPPNQRRIYSLTGALLCNTNVDAGCRIQRFTDAGPVRESWDIRGAHSQTDYDELFRPTAIHHQSIGQTSRVTQRFVYAANASQNAAHNQCGRLIRRDDGAGSVLYSDYGLTGHSLSETRHFLNNLEQPDWPATVSEREKLLENGMGAITHWAFSPVGEMLSQLDASGNRQRSTYTVAGQLGSLKLHPSGQSELTVLQDLSYTAFGQLSSQTAGNGVVSRADYDAADGHLLRLTASRPGRGVLQDLSYGYDPVGNIVRVEDHTQSIHYFNNQRVDGVNNYVYDSLDQLIEATGREALGGRIQPGLPELGTNPGDTSQLINYTQHYQYDAGGNLTQLRHVGKHNYTRDMQVASNSNRSLPVTQGKTPVDFPGGFDANGNLLKLEGGQTLQWNGLDQLHSVVLLPRAGGNDDVEHYTYDGAGQRVRKVRITQAKTTTLTTEVRYLPGLEIRSKNSERLEVMTLQADHCTVRYLYWVEGKPQGIDNNQLRFGLNDHLNSSSLEVDDQGKLLSHEGYYPYGGTAWWAAKSALQAKYKTIRYSGKERDASGLYYYGFRYYAPWLQRWINPDPAGDADGLNLYKMVNNSPLTLVDPNGLMFARAAAKVVGGAGIAGYQVYKSKNQIQDASVSTPSSRDNTGLKTPGETQANKWLEKSQQHVLKPEDKIIGSFSGRLATAFNLAQGQLPGAKAIAKGAELTAEAAQFATHSEVSEINKTSLAKSAVVDTYNNLGNVVTATKKALHTTAVAATVPTQKQNEIQDELRRRGNEAKDGLTTSVATGVGVAGVLDTAAILAPPGPIKLGIMGASFLWKATGVVHTAEELSKIAEQHKDLTSNELGKNAFAQVKDINKQKRAELINQYVKNAS